ncbi:MAG: D-hexose-6-phosphate mutarotase [Candidatus Sumerlaeia bacterium]|nr:D-hexose-6-phosphate mutarotase [Candidatus Sumerlaeia bacterium]
MSAEWILDFTASGLPRLCCADADIRAEVMLNGAHLTAFEQRATGRALLWLAPGEEYIGGRAIRGGVPLVFPWFGPHATDATRPRHGFARNLAWSLEETVGRRIVLGLRDSEVTRFLWPHRFHARLAIQLADTGVRMTLTVRNEDTSPLAYECAFHPYFAVSDATQACVEGLAGRSFRDKVAGGDRIQQGSITFPGAVDRVVEAPRRAVVLHDGGRPHVRIAHTGATEIVVWNPGPGKDGSPASPFVCVEPANCLHHPVTLAPGKEHALVGQFELM